MRPCPWMLLLSAVALPCSCGGTPAFQPAAATSPSASPEASTGPAAVLPAPSSASAGSLAPPAPPATSPFHPVLASPYPAPVVSAWPGGALIVTHGLIVAVKGNEVLQRASWLTGLPEIVNWDADVSLVLPPGAQVDSTLPAGTLMAVHAGNRHGPDESRAWHGVWRTGVPAEDPRKLAVYRDVNRQVLTRMNLPGNRAMMIRTTDKGGVESLWFEPGGRPATASAIPVQQSDYSAWLIGPPESIRLCFPSGEIFAYKDGQWGSDCSARGPIRGCAATSGGTIWVIDGKGGVAKRTGDEWEQVPLPPKVEADTIHAGGERLWLTAGDQVLSTEPVSRDLRIQESQLPGQVYFGISGLDATGPELASVSRDPAGPGTAACDSLVLFLGAKPGAELRSILQADPAASGLHLFEAQGSEGGTLFVPPGAGAQMKLRPSTRSRKALYLVPRSFEEGKRLAEKLRGVPGEPKPALLCAVPRDARAVGLVSSMK